MANLAIKGHATRSKEVIEILEMLGGKSYTGLAYKGEDPDRYYCIDKETNFINASLVPKGFQVFSIEEFLEGFPYKVGDKAFAFGNKCTIIDAVWDESIDEVVYTIKLDTSKYTTTKLSNQLQLYKEQETMEETIKIDIPKGYEFAGVDDDNQQVVFEKIGCQYPKTYEECCKILDWNHRDYDKVGYKSELLCKLQVLLLCRDAYWKIAGEQMGLGKPWEPNWENVYENHYTIVVCKHNLKTGFNEYSNRILMFPTEEMRDAFYENFKDLIEYCKELL